jgi:hypothetical protein
MKKVLMIMALCTLMVPAVVYAQSAGTRPAYQYMTILPADVSSKIGCCVAPYNKIWIDRETKVIWQNGDIGSVQLKFGSGDKCSEVTAVQLKSTVEIGSGCYVVKEMTPGATVTMQFGPGTYEYTLEFPGERVNTATGTRKPETGTISVF